MKKHISILIPRGHSSLVNIAGSHQIFNQVNGFLKEMGKGPLFEVDLVGISNPTAQTDGLFTVHPNKLLKEVIKTDLIIIPAIHGSPEEVYDDNKEFAPWIVQQYKNGAEVASFCIGAFFLAETGLLNGKQCATHWIHANAFKKMFPEVHLVNDKIMTEDSGIYTSGGAYSYLNLLMYLVEKYAGRELAILTSKAFMIDIDRFSQSPFIIFQGQKGHEDEPVKKAQEFIENNFQDKIGVQQLADQFALSKRSLERRFKSATGNSVNEYLQRVKVEAAKKELETERKNVYEVMFSVGYTDTKAFREVFKKHSGMTPLDYRKKFNSNFSGVVKTG